MLLNLRSLMDPSQPDSHERSGDSMHLAPYDHAHDCHDLDFFAPQGEVVYAHDAYDECNYEEEEAGEPPSPPSASAAAASSSSNA